jgi:hypothetical protein
MSSLIINNGGKRWRARRSDASTVLAIVKCEVFHFGHQPAALNTGDFLYGELACKVWIFTIGRVIAAPVRKTSQIDLRAVD